MMPRKFCFLCTSDEGIFVDITEANKDAIQDQLEICSLNVEFTKPIQKRLKQLCHKCAYELKQCSSFVKKFNQTFKSKKSIKNLSKTCSLCLSSGKTVQLFCIETDDQLQSFVSKIETFCSNKVYEGKVKSLCLQCQYTLDVLCDLRKLYQDTVAKPECNFDESTKALSFPKTRTRVIDRETAITESRYIHDSFNTDTVTESDTMAKSRNQKPKANNSKKLSAQSRLGSCSECHSTFERETDIFRLHKTKEKICKKCCLTEDSDIGHSTSEQHEFDIKSCSVFVKDVLTDNQVTVKNDKDGHRAYTVKEKTPESEKAPQRLLRGQRALSVDATETKISKVNRKRALRNCKSSAESSDSEYTRSKRQNKSKHNGQALKQQHTPDASPVQSKQLRTRSNRDAKPEPPKDLITRSMVAAGRKRAVSDSEEIKKKKTKPAPKLRVVSETEVTEESISRETRQRKSSRNRKGVTETKHTRKKTPNNNEIIETEADDSSTENSMDVTDSETTPKKLKSLPVENKEVTVEDEKMITESPSTEVNEPEKSTQSPQQRKSSESEVEQSVEEPKEDIDTTSKSNKRSRSMSGSSIETPRKTRATISLEEEQSPSSKSVKSVTVESVTSNEDNMSEEAKTYECNECGTSYENKLLCLTHQLTHYKQPQVKLERVAAENSIPESKSDMETGTEDTQGEEPSDHTAIRLEYADDNEDVEVDVVNICVDNETLSGSKKEEDEASKKAEDEASKKEEDEVSKKEEGEVSKKEEDEASMKEEVGASKEEENKASKKDENLEKTSDTPDIVNSTEKDSESQEIVPVEETTEGSDENKSEIPVLDSSTQNEASTVVNQEGNDKDDVEIVDSENVNSNNSEKVICEEVKDGEKEADIIEVDSNVPDTVDKDSNKLNDTESTKSNVDSKTITIMEVESDDDIMETLKDDTVSEKVKDTSETEVKNKQSDVEPQVEESAQKNGTCDEIRIEEREEKEVDKETKDDECKIVQDLESTKLDVSDSPKVDVLRNVSSTAETDEKKSTEAAVEVLQEVFDLAAAEVQKREDGSPKSKNVNEEEDETLENITREIENSGDPSSLDVSNKHETQKETVPVA